MSNQEKLATQTSTTSKTRTITGIVLAVLIAVGIGTAIWYFAAVVLNQTINFTEDFSNADHLVVKDDAQLIPKTEILGQEVEPTMAMYSSESTFSRNIEADKINYLCPNGLKEKIQTVEIYTANNQTKIDSSLIGRQALNKFVKIKINGHDIDSETNGTADVFLPSYFKNFDSVNWSDLLRWSSDNPEVLWTYNNGTIVPIFQGTANVQVGICGISSNKLPLTVDEGMPETYTFDNVTTAGMGTSQQLFGSFVNRQYTAGVILSKNLFSENHDFSSISGEIAYRPSVNEVFFLEYLNFFLSFDDGDTWIRIPLNQGINNNATFDYELPQNVGNKLKYTLTYKYSTDFGIEPDHKYSDEYTNANENLWLKEKQGNDQLVDKKVIYLSQENNTNIVTNDYRCAFNQLQTSEKKSNFLMEPFFSKGPGISNYQKIYKCVGGFGLGENPLETPEQVDSAVIVSMPSSLVLDHIDLSAKTATECRDGEELVDGNCTTPLPPDGGDPVDCKDGFTCPEGKVRQACTQECLGPDSATCKEGEVLINEKCESVLEKGNDAALMVNPKIIYKGADRAIIAWTVSNDEYKNKELAFKYGTFDAKDLKKDANGKIVLEDENSATVHYIKDENFYYVVLRNLKGGELVDKNNAGYVNGRKPYVFQISLGEKFADPTEIKTLNRFQTILYYYNLVLSENFDVNKYEQVDKDIRSGGPAFYYKPEGQEPMSLKGVQFTLLNDRKFNEFDNRIGATAKKFGNKKTVQELYSRVHDRIYDDDLAKKYDDAGVDYWTKQIERNDDNRIDILGAKFAISVSPEAVGEIKAMSAEDQKKANSDLAYEIVLKRGGDQKGVTELVKLKNPKEMRQKLANSKEFDDRLKSIKGKTEQIKELYETLYARAADIAGVNYWNESGKSIQEIKQEFLNSADFSNVAL